MENNIFALTSEPKLCSAAPFAKSSFKTEDFFLASSPGSVCIGLSGNLLSRLKCLRKEIFFTRKFNAGHYLLLVVHWEMLFFLLAGFEEFAVEPFYFLPNLT